MVVGGMHGGGHAWWGACVVVVGVCMAVGVHGWGACMVGGACMVALGGVHRIRSMSGRYASYWNAFLLRKYP